MKEDGNDGENVDSPSDSEDDVEKAITDNIGEKLISFKSPNIMNQMLPYAPNGVANQVKEEVKPILGKRLPEGETAELEKEQKSASINASKRR